MLKIPNATRIMQAFAKDEKFIQYNYNSFYIVQDELIKSFSIHVSKAGVLHDVRFSVSPLCAESVLVGDESIPLSAFTSHYGGYIISKKNNSEDIESLLNRIVEDTKLVVIPFFQRCVTIPTTINETLSLLKKTAYRREQILWIPELYQLAKAGLDYELMYQCLMTRYKTNLREREKNNNPKRQERIDEIIFRQEQELYHIKMKDKEFFTFQVSDNITRNMIRLSQGVTVSRGRFC